MNRWPLSRWFRFRRSGAPQETDPAGRDDAAILEKQQPILRDEPKFAAGRVAVFQYITIGVFLFLISAFWDLQVQNPQFYNERAEENRVRSIPLPAPRGKIVDRDGRVIVDNTPSVRLILSRERYNPDHLPAIAQGLNMDADDMRTRIERFRSPKYVPLVLKEELTLADIAFVEAHRDAGTFPELELLQAPRRVYPQGGFAAHMVGYVGEISEDELNTVALAKYEEGDIIGKAGIEKQYDDLLRGEDGERRVVVDFLGRERQVLDSIEAVPGKKLELTIDLDLQAVAELAMDGRRGSVVAIDPRSGEVLAMVSRPAYDPNKFAVRILAKDWRDIMLNPDKPMINRAIQAQLAPGSTYKPLMAMAGLDSGVLTPDFRVRCGGGASFYGHYFKCHKRGGHGTVDLKKAIAQSCDVFFYTLGNRMGIDMIAKYSEMAGLGSRTGIDLPQETPGVMPSTMWKMRNFREKWYAGETISVSIGQGAVAVSPLQLAHAMGGIATGGVWQKPHMVKGSGGEAKRANFDVGQVLQVIDGMYAVVNEGGTGGSARLPGLDVCGKTGTAQLASNQVLKGTKIGRTMKDNGWFFGFAPRQSPEVLVVALFEGSEHGTEAAPIVRDVIKAYFDKKARVDNPKLLSSAKPDVVAASFSPAAPQDFSNKELR